jgi:hypothetical protein
VAYALLLSYSLPDVTMSIAKPIQTNLIKPNKPNSMNEDNTLMNPELICDEQLEEIAGGVADVSNNSCNALLQATAQINL